MANSDKNIVITPNIGAASDPKIVFSGADAATAAQNITLTAYPTNGGTLSFDGSTGQLFSVTNSMSGTIFSANDVSGIPSIEVLDTGLVKIAQYSGNLLLGSGTDTGLAKLQVAGNIRVSTNATNPIHIGQNTGATAYNSISLNGNTTDSGNMGMTGGGNSDTVLYINSTGNITFRTNSFGQTPLTLTSAGASILGNTVLHAGNYTSYSPTLTGGSASGTWSINVTGNAATATTAAALSTTSTISSYMSDVGVLFQSYNASASNAAQFNITHAYGAVTISNARGALTLNGNVSGSSGSTTGNAATASAVTMSAARTDSAAYPVVWATTGGTSQMYSATAVNIQSSTGTLNATLLNAGSGGLNSTYALGDTVGLGVGSLNLYSDTTTSSSHRLQIAHIRETAGATSAGTYDQIARLTSTSTKGGFIRLRDDTTALSDAFKYSVSFGIGSSGEMAGFDTYGGLIIGTPLSGSANPTSVKLHVMRAGGSSIWLNDGSTYAATSKIGEINSVNGDLNLVADRLGQYAASRISLKVDNTEVVAVTSAGLVFANGTSPNSNTIQFGDNTGWNFRFMTSVSGTSTTRFTFSDAGAFTAVSTISASNFSGSHSGTSSGTNTGDNPGVTSVTATTPIVSSGGTTPNITHATSGATAGTYNNVTVNTFGHVTAGSNVGYISGYTETDTLATVTARGATTSTGVTLSNAANHYSGHFYYDSHDAAGNHYPHFLDGGSASGVKINWRLYAGASNTVTHTWTTSLATFATNIAATNFSGSSSGTNTGDNPGVTSVAGVTPIVSSGGTTPSISHATSGATAGTYNNVTVNTFGHVTAGSNAAYLTDAMRDRGGTTTATVDTATLSGFYNQANAGDSHSLLVFNPGGSTAIVQQRFHYTGSMEFRNKTDSATWNAWKTVLTSSNYNSYSPTLTGGSASGTWGINITGNAATATTATNLYGAGASYIASSTSGTSYSNAIQVREAGLGGAQGSAIAYAPRLGFHWSGVVASSIVMEASGRIGIVNNHVTAYESFVCGTLTASNFSGTSSGTNTGDNAGVTSVAGVTPIVSSGGTTPSISHATSGATAGTYNNVTVNTFGHVTAGSNTAYLTALSDTLATVTARGNTTTTSIQASNLNPAYSVSNFDTIKAPGLYQYDGAMTSTPNSDANYRTIEIGSNGRYSQIALNYSSDGMWFRRQTDANWSTWRQVWHSGNLTNLNQLTNGPGYVTSSGVTSVTGTAPVVSSGGTTPAISMAAATTSVAGYLTAADWTTFNNKQATGLSLLLTGGSMSGTITSASSTNLTLTAAGSASTASTAFAVNITGGIGWDSSAAGKGGAVNITGGRAGNNTTSSGAVMGGTVTITGGAGNTLFAGSTPGNVTIFGGAAQIAGQAGADVTVSASNGYASATNSTGGNLYLVAGTGSGSSGSNGFVQISAPGTGGGTAAVIKFITSTSERARINTGLSVGTTTDAGSTNILAAGNITAYSDIRLKTDLKIIPNALFKVKQLTGYTYIRTDSGVRQTGLVAQDVQKVLPEAVSEGEYLSLAYGNMVGLLVEAIKEQQTIIDSQESRIARLENLVSKLIEG